MLVKINFNKGLQVEAEVVSRRLVDLVNWYSREAVLRTIDGRLKHTMLDLHLNNLSETYPETYLSVCDYMFFNQKANF